MRPLLAAMSILCAPLALAQSPNSTYPTPRIASIFPMGVQKGTESVEVTVTGSDLDDATKLIVRDGLIKAERIDEPPQKVNPKDIPKGGRRPVSTTSVRFKLTIPKYLGVGQYDLRFVGRFGISNPRTFTVGNRPEVVEANPNDDVPQAQRVELGTVVNGVIDAATDVDYYVFKGKKGKRVILHCAAGSIDSRARPLVEVFAADGKTRLAGNRNYLGTDALVDFDPPQDGDYFVRVCEFAYVAGGPDYFYRLTVGTGQWIDAIFPPMIDPTATRTSIRLIGRELGTKPDAPIMQIQGNNVVIQEAGLSRGIEFDLHRFHGHTVLPQAMGLPDGLAWHDITSKPLVFATAPVVLEAMQPNDTFETAQAVTTPCEVAGTILTRNDRDCYKFDLKKGDVRMVELFADRVGSAMDAYLVIKGPDGREIAGESVLDDDPEYLHPTSFFNKTTDPAAYKLTAAVDGTYTVMVATRDGNVNFGPRSLYRLRLATPQPDFRVVAMGRHRDLPSSICVRPDCFTAVDVFVQRMDGFNGPITVTLKNLPKGVTQTPARIGFGQRWGTILLSANKDVKDAEAIVTGDATALIDDKPVTRDLRSASIVWGVPNQQGGPTIARQDEFLAIAVRNAEPTPFRIVPQWDKAVVKGPDGKERPAVKPLAAKPGEKIVVPVKIEWRGEGSRPNLLALGLEATKFEQNLNAITLNNNQAVNVAKDKTEMTVSLEVQAKAAPGLYHAVLRGDTKLQMVRDAMTKEKKEYTLVAFAEPVAVTVLPTLLGKLSVASFSIKPGGTATMVVKVERAYDYAGPFPLKFEFPASTGLSAADTVLPAKANEISVTVTAAKDAKTGTNDKGAVKAVAEFESTPVSHEARIQVTVQK